MPLAKKKGIEIKLKIQDCVIEADEEALAKMMLIFLDNGVKYTPKGGRVIVSNEIEGKDVLIDISDTGMGIDERDIPHIFDRFYQADKSRTKIKTDGFGLGLALAREIIKLHKGSVSVSSNVDKGTAFNIKLPLRHS